MATFVADTGAEVTAISSTLARRLGIRLGGLDRRVLRGALGAASCPFIPGLYIWFDRPGGKAILLPAVAVLGGSRDQERRNRGPISAASYMKEPDVSILVTDAYRALRARVVADFGASNGYIEW